MDYPFDEGFRQGEWQGLIRLKVAAICACLDHARSGGDGLSACEEEVERYFVPVATTAPDGSLHKSPLDPHAYLYVEPEGNLADDVETVLAALIASISSAELKPAALRVALNGEVNPVDTWIFLSDFRKWCKTRGLELYDVVDDYENGEANILCQADANAEDMRKALEAPMFDAEFLMIRRPDYDSHEGLIKRYEELYLKSFFWEHGYETPATPADAKAILPMAPKERNSLLLIIAALCNKAGIDHKDRSAAGDIAKLIDQIPASLTQPTIRNVLDQIPDAIGRRMLSLHSGGKK